MERPIRQGQDPHQPHLYPIAHGADARMRRMDPYAVLGIRPGSPEREVLKAYREQAKRWHPDRGAGEDAAQRMAEINAAYDLVRAAQQHEATAPPRTNRGRSGAAARAPDAAAG